MSRLRKAWQSVLTGRLPVLFLLVTVVPAAALIALGVRLASQDRVLVAHRSRKRGRRIWIAL